MTVTVFGNSGAGKSTFSALLARELSKQATVILINFDKNTPMMPVWLPGRDVTPECSLGYVLDSLDINTDVLARAVVFPEKQANLGLCSYLLKDTVLSFAEETEGKIDALVQAAGELADYVILDLPPDFGSKVTPTALWLATVRFCVLTPDLRGAAFYTSAKALLERNPKFHWEQTRFVAGNGKPYHAVEALEALTGPLFGALPYREELELMALQGDLLRREPPGVCRKVVDGAAGVVTHG